MKKLKQGPKKVSNMLKTLMVVICELSPHNNHLIRLYSCPQNKFQISAKCCLCCKISISKISTKARLPFHRCDNIQCSESEYLKELSSSNNVFTCSSVWLYRYNAEVMACGIASPTMEWNVYCAIRGCPFIT